MWYHILNINSPISQSDLIGNISPPDSLYTCIPQKHYCPTKAQRADGGPDCVKTQFKPQPQISNSTNTRFIYSEKFQKNDFFHPLPKIEHVFSFTSPIISPNWTKKHQI